jgi:hypothetical protein
VAEHAATPVQVVLYGLRGMLADIAEAALLADPGIEVIGRPGDSVALVRLVREHAADVVILGSDSAELPPVGWDVLMPESQTRVLTICDDGREGYLYELRPHETRLAEVSPQSLRDAVRAAAEDAA